MILSTFKFSASHRSRFTESLKFIIFLPVYTCYLPQFIYRFELHLLNRCYLESGCIYDVVLQRNTTTLEIWGSISSSMGIGSFAPSRSSRNRRIELTLNLSTYCMGQRMDIGLFKQIPCLCGSGKSPLIHGLKLESPKVSSFKGSVQSDEYKNQVQGSKFRNNWVKLSYVSWDNKNISLGSPKLQNIHVNSTSDADVTTEGSLAIHRIFKSWLAALPLASRNQDEAPLNKRVETDHKLLKHGILKTIWCYFLGMNATIKVPAIILIPLFLTVNVKYGAQVAKELSPLWIGGPLLVALYIKMVQTLCSLYVFGFKQSVKVLTVSYGNEREFILVHFWRQVVYFINLDYKYEFKRIRKDFQVWLVDACLDFVESISSYRKMIRVLKIAKIM